MNRTATALESRGTAPRVFAHNGLIVIHAENPQFLGPHCLDDSTTCVNWYLKAAGVLPQDREKARGVLNGQVSLMYVEFRRRRSQAARLLHRSVREYRAGNFVRASQLAAAAQSASVAERFLEMIDVIRGYIKDAFGDAQDSYIRRLWLEQAAWWAGGEWSGDGNKAAAQLEHLTRQRTTVMLRGDH